VLGHNNIRRDQFFVLFGAISEILGVPAMNVAVVSPDVLLDIVAFRGWAVLGAEGARVMLHQ
jgi:hypothetical protein